jgi:hypothetical protein
MKGAMFPYRGDPGPTAEWAPCEAGAAIKRQEGRKACTA